MHTRILFALSLIAAPLSFAAEPLPARTLFEQCSAYIQTPEGADGQLCDAYLRGFLQGAKAAGGKQRSAGNEESWTDRAARTRLGNAALARASYCLPSNITPAELAERFVRNLEKNPGLKDTDARTALEATLHVNFPCVGGRG